MAYVLVTTFHPWWACRVLTLPITFTRYRVQKNWSLLWVYLMSAKNGKENSPAISQQLNLSIRSLQQSKFVSERNILGESPLTKTQLGKGSLTGTCTRSSFAFEWYRYFLSRKTRLETRCKIYCSSHPVKLVYTLLNDLFFCCCIHVLNIGVLSSMSETSILV
jgi:hypothetical protein